MNQRTYTRTITLKDLWDILLRRLLVMILAAVIVAGSSFVFEKLTYQPQYESIATMYLMRQNDTASNAEDASIEFNLALKVVNDCTYLLKSRTVVAQVIDELSLDMTYETLSSKIATRNPTNTRILEVKVEADSPEQAKQIVDTLCRIGQVEISTAMGFDQVNLYEYGALNTTPCNPISISTHLILGLAVAIVLYLAAVVSYLLDDRIRTDEDVERYLGLSILGEISNLEGEHGSRYGYYGYGNRAYKHTNRQSGTKKRS